MSASTAVVAAVQSKARDKILNALIASNATSPEAAKTLNELGLAPKFPASWFKPDYRIAAKRLAKKGQIIKLAGQDRYYTHPH